MRSIKSLRTPFRAIIVVFCLLTNFSMPAFNQSKRKTDTEPKTGNSQAGGQNKSNVTTITNVSAVTLKIVFESNGGGILTQEFSAYFGDFPGGFQSHRCRAFPLLDFDLGFPDDWRSTSSMQPRAPFCDLNLSLRFTNLSVLNKQLAMLATHPVYKNFGFVNQISANKDGSFSIHTTKEPFPLISGLMFSSTAKKKPVSYNFIIEVPEIIKTTASGDAVLITSVKDGKKQISWSPPDDGKYKVDITGELKISEVDICNRATDEHPATSESIKEARTIVKDNIIYILDAAKEFQVDPKIIAGAIFSEHARNISPGELVLDEYAARIGFDMSSLGLAQVRVDTAKRIEVNGCIEKPSGNFPLTIGWSLEREARITTLMNPKQNARYVAAYIKCLESMFPEVKGKPTTLIHLFNLGEYDKKTGKLRKINNPPGYDCFAADARSQFEYFESIGIK